MTGAAVKSGVPIPTPTTALLEPTSRMHRPSGRANAGLEPFGAAVGFLVPFRVILLYTPKAACNR